MDSRLTLVIRTILSEMEITRITKSEIEEIANNFRCTLYDEILMRQGGNQSRTVRQLGLGEKFFSDSNGSYSKWKKGQ